ncbi:MAG: glycerol-3-phosphate 1-O-acyltransferase PlsY [Roseovarius sp.]|nr:glycerol-3-phosphate 1-O-acyltransferase PlsY [Roseovarius sp.]MCY4292041.1 glycerol-3-phosphate 1-O-acyltransferase PlsY [Roseovarius sp.]MCY4315000.1 glycerol-3-phosphate 1-O-acyltransferase PlsY [Roseovarius sp.]
MLGSYLAYAAAGYFLGSIPFGLVIAKLLRLGDLRKIGSGNIGATNVLRTGNKGAAAATLLLDAAKGAVAVLIGRFAESGDVVQITGLMAFIGHCFPVWLMFRGGKGVATFIGIVLALSLPAGIATCLTWLAVAFLFRISSLSALISCIACPMWLIILGKPEYAILSVMLAVLVWVRHAQNIRRILNGEEPRIGKKR